MSSIFTSTNTREPPHAQPRCNSQVVETICNVADEVWRLEQRATATEQAHAKALYDLEEVSKRNLVLYDDVLTWRAVQRTTHIRGQQEIDDLKEEIKALKLEVLLPASQPTYNRLQCGHTSHAPCLKKWFDTVTNEFEEDLEVAEIAVLTLKCMWCNEPVVNAPLQNYLVESAASGLPDAHMVDHHNWSAQWSCWWHLDDNMNVEDLIANATPEEEISQVTGAALGDGESEAGRLSMEPVEFSSESLRSHLDRLLHKSSPGNELQGWDGRCGTLYNQLDDLLITTPNASTIWAPPLGAKRVVKMYKDYRYGDDDLCSWPQILPRHAEFEECDVSCLIRGPGLWNRIQCKAFQLACDQVIQTSLTCRIKDDRHVKVLRSLLQMFLQHVKALPLTFERLRLCVAEMQRVALELRAYIEYHTTFTPRIHSPSSIVWKAKSDLMGAFTTSTLTAQEFHKAGIPVWLLRSVSVVPFTRIDEVVQVQEHDTRLNLRPCPLCLREVYVGPASNEEKNWAIKTFTCSHFSSPNPFFWTPGIPPSVEGVSNVSPSERYKPYKHQGVEHCLLPPLLAAWREALFAVNTSPEHAQVPTAGYAFPRPELFVTVQSIFALLAPPFNPPLLPHQTWQTVLQFDWLLESSSDAPGSGVVNDHEAKRCERASMFLKGCKEEITIVTPSCHDPTWVGKHIPDLDDDDIQAILWELAEVGFRMELMSLDARLYLPTSTSTTDADAHKHLLRLCFPPLNSELAWIVRLKDANQGLGNPIWILRAPYVCTLRWVMCIWPNCPSILRKELCHYDEEQFLQMERHATGFYIDCFFKYFGHVPILPRALVHPPPFEGPTPLRPTLLSNCPGIYTDLTQWEDCE
ncbi:hypothetical protein ARMGADRAFT_1092468 [Armillaria gallica]|uniref:Uncharacterized protein n=1 Tax=Armillaria gallica TaxID=47427 RepID=A0A2H3CP48_ARMGA|nr:hypothetical protein ARMGADRAFT_1092468 [Armillaria gallica]